MSTNVVQAGVEQEGPFGFIVKALLENPPVSCRLPQ